MRKNKFLAALAIAACLATSVPLSASAATLGQAASASEVTYSKVSVADQAKIKEVYVAADYAELNPDLVAAGLSGDALFNHFITAGIFEGRQANKNFNVAVYKSAYADLQKEFKNDIVAYYVHYVNHGKAEGRSITTVDAAKSNGVEVKSLFSDKVILDKVVAAPASSSSSSTPAPTPSTDEKTEEETKPTDEQIKESHGEEKKDQDIKFPANNGTGSYSVYAPDSNARCTLSGIASIGSLPTAAVEAKMNANVEYDYVSGQFYYTTALPATEKKDVYSFDTASGYTTFDGVTYYKLEAVDTATNKNIVAGVVKITKDDITTYHVKQTLDGYMPVRATNKATANNYNMGFIQTNDPVLEETATLKGLNPALWEKDSNGLWHQVVSEKDVYKKNDGSWNYTKTSSGDPEWVQVKHDGVEVFRTVTGNTSMSCLVVTESPYLRIENRLDGTHVATSDAQRTQIYNSAYKAAQDQTKTISEAGKTSPSTFVLANDNYTKRQAMYADVDKVNKKGIRENKRNGFDVGKVVNEFFTVEPAEGYFLDYDVADTVVAYRYTDDYHYACNPNWEKYMVLNGRYVEIAAWNFTEAEIEAARYCKPGYTKYNGKYYEVIAEKETSNDKWLKANWHWDDSWYAKATYLETKTYSIEEIGTKESVPKDPSKCVKIELGGKVAGAKYDEWYLVETDLSKIFVGYPTANTTFGQSTVNGRFYKYFGN